MDNPTIARFKIPEEHKKWLEERAKKECVSVTSIIRRMIANAYSKRNAK